MATQNLRANLIDKLIDWIEFVTPLSEHQIIAADDRDGDDPPDTPYITVHLPTLNIPEGTDETRFEADGDELNAVVTADRRAIVELTGYGPEGADHLANCQVSLARPDVRAFFKEENVGVRHREPTEDVSEDVDGELQKRFRHRFDLTYRIQITQPDAEQHVETVAVDVEMGSDEQNQQPNHMTLEVD